MEEKEKERKVTSSKRGRVSQVANLSNYRLLGQSRMRNHTGNIMDGRQGDMGRYPLASMA